MKNIVLILSLFIFSCGSSDLHEQKVVNKEVEYFRDNRTGLCFGTLQSFNFDGDIWSFTCVPCDSVKHLLK